jgi:hypothetical protein
MVCDAVWTGMKLETRRTHPGRRGRQRHDGDGVRCGGAEHYGGVTPAKSYRLCRARQRPQAALVTSSPPHGPPEQFHVEGEAATEEIEGGGALGIGAQAAARCLLGFQGEALVRRRPFIGDGGSLAVRVHGAGMRLARMRGTSRSDPESSSVRSQGQE